MDDEDDHEPDREAREEPADEIAEEQALRLGQEEHHRHRCYPEAAALEGSWRPTGVRKV
jgi:hypothetical protein